VIVIAALLSLVQKRMSPGTEVFFLPSSVAEEMSYLSTPRDAPAALRRVSDLARSFLLSNLAAPELRVTQPEGPPPVARFGALRPVGWVHAVLWIALLLAGGMARWRRDLLGRPLVRALLLWIAFNLGLHFFYGDILFLYSCHWTFAVLAVAAVAIEAGCPARARRAVPALLCLMAGLQAWANGALFIELHRLYR
jgi:hypothetical protein